MPTEHISMGTVEIIFSYVYILIWLENRITATQISSGQCINGYRDKHHVYNGGRAAVIVSRVKVYDERVWSMMSTISR